MLFDRKTHMKAVINQISQDNNFVHFKKFFLFSTIDLIKDDFTSWYEYDYSKAIL